MSLLKAVPAKVGGQQILNCSNVLPIPSQPGESVPELHFKEDQRFIYLVITKSQLVDWCISRTIPARHTNVTLGRNSHYFQLICKNPPLTLITGPHCDGRGQGGL